MHEKYTKHEIRQVKRAQRVRGPWAFTIPWPGGATIKLSYINDTPEAQVKLQDCFALKEHPTLCEGRLPVLLTLCTPGSKRLATTTDWPAFVAREWPKHRQAVAKKFASVMWR